MLPPDKTRHYSAAFPPAMYVMLSGTSGPCYRMQDPFQIQEYGTFSSLGTLAWGCPLLFTLQMLPTLTYSKLHLPLGLSMHGAYKTFSRQASLYYSVMQIRNIPEGLAFRKCWAPKPLLAPQSSQHDRFGLGCLGICGLLNCIEPCDARDGPSSHLFFDAALVEHAQGTFLSLPQAHGHL